MYEWLLFFHVLFAALWFGGSIYVEGLMAGARRTDEAESRNALLLRVSTTNRRLFTVAGIAAIIFGFWLVFEVGYVEFEMAWVAIAVAASIFAVAVDLFYSTPRADELARIVAEKGSEDPGAVMRVKQIGAAAHARSGLLLVAFVMMIFKPWA